MGSHSRQPGRSMPESLPRGQKSGTEESCHSREGGAHPGLATWDAHLTLPSELGILTQGHEVVSAGTGRQECCPAGGWRAGLRTPPPMAGHSLTVQQEPCSGAHAWGQLRLVSHIPAERLAKAPVGGHSPCPPHPRISPRLSRRSCWKTGHAILDVWHAVTGQHSLGLEQQNPFSHSPGGQISKIKVWAGEVSLETSLLGLSIASFSPRVLLS